MEVGYFFRINISMLILKNKKLFLLLVVIAIVISIFISAMKINGDSEETLSSSGINEQYSDGPYVISEQQELTAYWLCNGKVEKEILDKRHIPLSLNYCDLTANVYSETAPEDTVLEYSGDYRVAAMSDFHGQYDLMKTLLVNNRVIDKDGNWNFDNGHFVITGDVFDRGDKVTEILWFLYKLERQAKLAGGQVHLLLGNHEVMVLNGDLRYLHEKYEQTALLLEKPFEELYSKDTTLGDWLRAKPVLVKVNNMLFAHGGFHPSLASEKRTLESINTVFKKSLVKAELETERGEWANYLHKKNGPIWYRGYFKDDGATPEEIEMLLNHFDVENIVVGHTSQPQIETRYQGKVIAIDSSIKKGEYGEILFVEGDKKWRGSLSGEILPLH